MRDVFTLALDNYKVQLQDIENKDLQTLRKTIGELKRVKGDLLRDMEEEETSEQAMLG